MEVLFNRPVELLLAPLFVGIIVALFSHWLNNRK